MAAAGSHAVKWQGLVSKVIIPGVLSPFIALGIAAVGTWWVYRLAQGVPKGTRSHGFRIGQIGSASMVSLAHGTNDAQKTMGVITLALVSNGTLASGSKAPAWVIVSCALAISLGTWLGGWRVIRTMGKGLTEIESPQGMAAEASSASAILLSSHFGYSLSTTQVATGSILGSGVGRRTEVRWNVAGRMVSAWIVTMPSAGAVGALAYAIANGIGGNAGGILVFLAVVAIGTTFYLHVPQDQGHPGQRQRRVDRHRWAESPRRPRPGGGMSDMLAASSTAWINFGRPVEDLRDRPASAAPGCRPSSPSGCGCLEPPAASGSRRGAPSEDDDRIYFGNIWGRHRGRGVLRHRAGGHRPGYLLDREQQLAGSSEPRGKDRPWRYPPSSRRSSTGCTPATRKGSRKQDYYPLLAFLARSLKTDEVSEVVTALQAERTPTGRPRPRTCGPPSRR